MNTSTWRLFWAKTDRTGKHPESWTRPLWAHLYDVANAAELLWQCYLPESLREQLSNALGLPDEEAGHMLSIWIGLHDLGKAIPAFQHQHEHTKKILHAAGLPFIEGRYDSTTSIHHGHASISLLYLWLKRDGAFSPELADLMESMAAFVGFHHGKLFSMRKWRDNAFHGDRSPLGKRQWREPQLQLADEVIRAWDPVWPRTTSVPDPWPSWLLGFAGWVTLADWVGSMAEFYPDDCGDDLPAYINAGREAAKKAIEFARLDLRAAITAPDFLDLFGEGGRIDRPRPLQQQLIDLPLPDGNEPTLTIVEAPTGEGKTEAAFYLAARQRSRRGGGIYVAMPSQATSNGLFGRFREFIGKAHDSRGGDINLLLVHGNSLLHPDQQKLLDEAAHPECLSGIYDDDGRRDDAESSRVLTASWFVPKKRSLLAPYGVGTVDQALLAGLFSKHFFLRLLGLAGKTIVFDEVHAYDNYMNNIFCGLLSWLRELGTDVILLSATLPGLMREEFLRAWGYRGAVLQGADVHYPAVWSVAGGECRSMTFPASQSQSAELRWLTAEPDAIITAVADAIAVGATVAVIVNMVSRAQAIFTAIREQLAGRIIPDEEIFLFHARFPFGLRLEREQRVLERFGKDRVSGKPGILIATQVAEQSLDLDVDLMLSDLAPIDLLLQRAGRLHRHAHHTRPTGYTEPLLTVLAPDADDGELPPIGEIGGGSVYAEHLLWKTWRLLRSRTGWTLPGDYRALVEGVYGGDASAPPEDLSDGSLAMWSKAGVEGDDAAAEERKQARLRTIQSPKDLEGMVTFKSLDLADEDEEKVHKQLQAVTRLGEPSVEVVCLHQGNDGRLYLDPECRRVAALYAKLSRDQVKDLQHTSLRLSNQAIVHFLFKQSPDPRWKPVAEGAPALMRHHLLIFRNRFWREQGRYDIEFNTTMGLIIHKQEG